MSSLIRILVDDREYTTWSFQDPDTNDDILAPTLPDTFHPSKNFLFSKDVFCVNSDDTIQIVHSPARLNKKIPGVLVLDNNKTYGRTANKKRLLYKCIPDDKHLPAFLVPYEIQIGFSKSNVNKYVIFRVSEWTANQKHPLGMIEETIGQVDQLEPFYEYQLYCKCLHISMTEMTLQTRTALNKKTHNEYGQQILKSPDYQIVDKTSDCVFTIDPRGSMDFDDGFSIKSDLENADQVIVSVYIANVYVWLDTLSLWSSFSERVATIYLPDRRRPMLPTVLSDALCSLQEGQDRFVFVMSVRVNKHTGEISEKDPVFYNALIKPYRNYYYEQPELVNDINYMDLLRLTQKMDRHATNSHDVVAFWMVQMNCQCARIFAKNEIGIFRSALCTNSDAKSDIDVSLPENTKRFIKMWNNTSGQYQMFSKKNGMEHELMKVKSYVHITSPIRRLVDLLNQMMFMRDILKMELSEASNDFICRWISKIEYINTSMRSIRKVQTECDLLYRCSNDPNIMDEIHDGVMFDKLKRCDGSYSYMVYFEKWKLLSRLTTHNEYDNYVSSKFRIFLFEDEDKTRRKIRIQIL